MLTRYLKLNVSRGRQPTQEMSQTALGEVRGDPEIPYQRSIGDERDDGGANGKPIRLSVRKSIVEPVLNTEDDDDQDVDYVCQILLSAQALQSGNSTRTMSRQKYETNDGHSRHSTFEKPQQERPICDTSAGQAQT